MNITKPTLTLLPPSSTELCNAKTKPKNKGAVTLVCLAKDFYPDHVNISWKVNHKERTYSVATDRAAQQDPETRFYRMSSRLQVNQTEWTNVKNSFSCVVTFYNGQEYKKVEDIIKFSPGVYQIPVKVYTVVQLCYVMFLSKSLLYAVFVSVLVWKCKATTSNTVKTENGEIMIR